MPFDKLSIDEFLGSYGRFGVNLGLSRIEALLNRLGNPQAQVPIVHVAGTNGKGSVCAYVASVLMMAGYRVGRYTSPHLLAWNERICINQRPVTDEALWQHLQIVSAAAGSETPTQFEVFTAAAWSYFAAEAVDIAVIEVGLGGRLDATNVCPQPLATAIVSLSREHWQRLGPTLADIAREKAGILKSGRPVVIGPLPPDADGVVRQRATELGCPLYEVVPAQMTGSGQWCSGLDNVISYSSGLLGEHQRINSAVAIALLQLLQRQGWQISTEAFQKGMAETHWPGRLQWVSWQGQQLLIDGAHNPAAAEMLRRYVDSLSQPVIWLMGMLATKDHDDIFQALLRSGDTLYIVPVPEHQTAVPAELAQLAQRVCPGLAGCYAYETLEVGLGSFGEEKGTTKVLCGSLYLVGDFLSRFNGDGHGLS